MRNAGKLSGTAKGESLSGEARLDRKKIAPGPNRARIKARANMPLARANPGWGNVLFIPDLGKAIIAVTSCT
jgi:hypothetical protein